MKPTDVKARDGQGGVAPVDRFVDKVVGAFSIAVIVWFLVIPAIAYVSCYITDCPAPAQQGAKQGD